MAETLDKYESNNTMATATQLNGAEGSLTNLSIHSNDVDWFKFTMYKEGDYYDSDLIVAEPTDYYVNKNLATEIYNSSGQKVVLADRSGNYSQELIT